VPLVAHRREQGVADLEPRRHARSWDVRATADLHEFAGPLLPPQFMVGPTCSDQLPTKNEARCVHAASMPPRRPGRPE
jgi:hypothetical protein